MSEKNPILLAFVVLFKVVKFLFLGITWGIIVLGAIVKNK